eukprot:10306078-Alexandrium_andersonii.AAC.1
MQRERREQAVSRSLLREGCDPQGAARAAVTDDCDAQATGASCAAVSRCKCSQLARLPSALPGPQLCQVLWLSEPQLCNTKSTTQE